MGRLCEAAQLPEAGLKVRQEAGLSPPPQVTRPVWVWECRESGSSAREQRYSPSEVNTSTDRMEVTRMAGQSGGQLLYHTLTKTLTVFLLTTDVTIKSK